MNCGSRHLFCGKALVMLPPGCCKSFDGAYFSEKCETDLSYHHIALDKPTQKYN
jgi:hypothetical protein